MTSNQINFQGIVDKTSSAQENPHLNIVKEKARAAVKDHISLIQGTFLTGKYREGLRSSYRNFADCDKIFTRLENRTNRLQRNLKASEKQEKIICSGLSAVPTIQANIAAAQSHFK
ncbi:Oidioi.mRNA.OKI2018_I69.chr2.g6018.t1.cds [Oikopleura dioica]|uniref:Oidioi.mRNA.OKI2018_I69.chr2.g6018.t1.cds n=1 Tax=Oikopleura dioica TaxID=34765 RepID=A0ABN7TB54_OIKDI|nr:Oidioi.mRNA.OKI2018_I69.chr2.g6018.t1.cds [Oikopleura dioica]